MNESKMNNGNLVPKLSENDLKQSNSNYQCKRAIQNKTKNSAYLPQAQ